MAFKKMECINNFCESARAYGVPNEENFQTVDLYESQNMWQVIICLQALARKVSIVFHKTHRYAAIECTRVGVLSIGLLFETFSIANFRQSKIITLLIRDRRERTS